MKQKEYATKILHLGEIQDPEVINFLRSEGLSLEVARKYTKEIVFADRHGNPLKGYGMPTDGGGWCVITTKGGTNNVHESGLAFYPAHENDNPSCCLLFIGLRDALAYHTLYGEPTYDVIVMFNPYNSNRAKEFIQQNNYSEVIFYAPNSPGKAMSMPIIKDSGADIKDMSDTYSDVKDLREVCVLKFGTKDIPSRSKKRKSTAPESSKDPNIQMCASV